MTRNRLIVRLATKEAKIAKLQVALAREKQYTNALSLLAFAATQDPKRMTQVRRAATLRKMSKPRRMKTKP